MNDNEEEADLTTAPMIVATATRIVATLHFAGVELSLEARRAAVAMAAPEGYLRVEISDAVDGMMSDIAVLRELRSSFTS
jgi:hypothetical protein